MFYMKTVTMLITRALLAGLLLISVTKGADIKASIPSSLRECYNDSQITTRDNLLPFTLTTFISLIRKLEDSMQRDMRILSSAILHSYRFDGIQRNPEIDWTEDVIPYSPTGSEFPLYKVLFDKLIPSTQQIPNNTLTYIERCTLHAMLSAAVDPWDRGDSGASCSKVSKYSSANSWDHYGNGFRFPRDVSKVGDAEVFDPKIGPGLHENTDKVAETPESRSGNFQQYMVSFPESPCPIESGVIYHKYGTVSPGIVLAGVATGLQQENVNVRNLMNLASPRTSSLWSDTQRRTAVKPTYSQRSPYDLSPYDRPSYSRPSFDRSPYDRPGQRVSFNADGYGGIGDIIDNRHAATLAGVLAEVSLLLGPSMDARSSGIKMITSGGWNDTAIPKYYFLTDYMKNALSDQKLRGSVDGLLLAKEVKKWSDSTSGSLKLSQVLGMYYSDRGLFGTDVKACNRINHLNEIAPQNELIDQASAFAVVLHDSLPESVVIKAEGIQRYVSTSTDEAMRYISSVMNDKCPQSGVTTTLSQSPAVDLQIVFDANYNYKDISKVLVYLVDNMEVNKYSSNISLINGFDGTVLLNSVQSPLDVYSNITNSYYNTFRKGFDFDKLLLIMRERMKEKLRNDDATSSGGGNARVVLFMPQASANINNKDALIYKINTIRQKTPDVKFIYLLTGSKDKFSSFADEPDKDIFIIPDFNNVAQYLDPLIKRIASVPKRIINPKCSPAWSKDHWYSPVTIRGYLEKPEVHYYRVHPNYFFQDTSARITVKNEDPSQVITVCSSRKLELPVNNQTRTARYSDANCKSLTGGQENVINIGNGDCSQSYATDCPPYYISVSSSQSTLTQISNMVSCTDPECKYPDMLKYTITHQGLGCYSGAGRFLGAPLIIALLVIFNFLR